MKDECRPVVQGFSYALLHAPELVRYGSKPKRQIQADPGSAAKINAHLRSFQEAVAYPPNQVFLGNLHPEDLARRVQPWWQNPVSQATADAAYGPFVDQLELYGFLKATDLFELVWFTPEFTKLIRQKMENHSLATAADLDALGNGQDPDKICAAIQHQGSTALYYEGTVVGSFQRAHDDDEALSAGVLMENLVTKASATVAVRQLLRRHSLDPESVDYILSCSEEAIGDRYQRGGGNLAKAVGESCGLSNATGCDVKAFCAGPLYAIMHAASLVQAGVFNRIVVFGGGCQSKLGMKFEGHLKHGMPILEDILGSMAFLINRDDGRSPVIRLDVLGRHRIADGSNPQAIMTSLVVRPLEKIGRKITDIDKIAAELHNPEVTRPQGSGDVPLNNYKLMAALAVMRGEIARADMEHFIAQHGMPGFAPTQGHIPAAVPYLGHASESMAAGSISTALFVAKGSLFLGRMSRMSDGLSFLLEKNGGTGHSSAEK